MKIISLKSENVKRLHAVEIKPDGSLVIIGGRNGQGKSSCLDSVQYALGGATTDRMPVRKGEESARVVVDLGEIVVRRSFTAAGGTSLTITNADGQKQLSPQTILDKLTGKLTFDPLEFARQNPKQQAETLRTMLGLDFSKQDAEKEKVFNERTNVNRDAKTLEARMKSMPKYDGMPEAETSTASIMTEQSEAANRNLDREHERNRALNLRKNANWSIEELAGLDAKIMEMQQNIKRVNSDRTKLLEKISGEKTLAEKAEAETAALVDESLTEFKTKLAEAESTNQKVRSNVQRAEIVRQFKAKSDEADKLTTRLDAIETEKRRAVMTAKFPIDGLSFDVAGGVVLAGIPFEQASSAEQLRVSVAIGLALNPKLRVLLIRDGSLLDAESLALVADMAAKADAQVWIERVGTGDPTAVIIEDGSVVEKEATNVNA